MISDDEEDGEELPYSVESVDTSGMVCHVACEQKRGVRIDEIEVLDVAPIMDRTVREVLLEVIRRNNVPVVPQEDFVRSTIDYLTQSDRRTHLHYSLMPSFSDKLNTSQFLRELTFREVSSALAKMRDAQQPYRIFISIGCSTTPLVPMSIYPSTKFIRLLNKGN